MVKTMKRRIFSGAVCEQYVYNAPSNVKNIKNYEPRPRFKDKEERIRHREEIAKRNHARSFNNQFSPESLYSTLTFDDDCELHTFKDAKRVARNFLRTLQYAYPDAVAYLYMGKGKTTHRIHFHMVSQGIPQEFIDRKWKYGSIKRISNLREHNYYDGVDHGRDYTGLANYLFEHWTPEQGGHHWMRIGSIRKPEKEDPTEVKIYGGYSAKRPPQPPKGYKLVEVQGNKYGYWYFKYVVEPPKDPRRSGGGKIRSEDRKE